MLDYAVRVLFESHQYGAHIMCNFGWLFSAKAEKEPAMAKAKKEDMSMAKTEKSDAMSVEAKTLKEPEMSMAKASKVMSVWVLSSPFMY